MADYSTLDEAIAAGVTNMTVLRNNVGNDANVTPYTTGIDWFRFNSVVVGTLYSSGDSFLGFGENAEQLQANRRDCKVFYEYAESGSIGKVRFYKFRWRGYALYSSTSSANRQEYEVFLLETGQLYLNFVTVPTSNLTGTKVLVCGAEEVPFTLVAGTPCEYTFTPTDPIDGIGWSVEAGRPDLRAEFYASGYMIFDVPKMERIKKYSDSLISWDEEKTSKQDVSVFAKVDSGEWVKCSNGSQIAGLRLDANYSSSILQIKVELSTSDTETSPKFSNLFVKINDANDIDVITLVFNPGTMNSIQNAIGPVKLRYDGGGTLTGLGGQVSAFEAEFLPTDLEWKGHQNDAEHIEMNAEMSYELIEISHNYGYESEHIELQAQFTYELKSIDDI